MKLIEIYATLCSIVNSMVRPTRCSFGRRTAAALSLLALIGSVSLAHAHEYWLEPAGTIWHTGDTLKADIKNGQDFAGTSFPFDPDGLSRAGLISASERVALSGRLGDYPAFQMPLHESGLHLLLLETTKRELVYKDREEVDEFLDYHALAETVYSNNAQFSIPDTDIRENYYRFCKALVSVSAPAADTAKSAQTTEAEESSEHALGAEDQQLELILSDNPLGAQSVRARVMFEAEPLAQRQVELFYRDASEAVTRTTQSSDDDGYVEFDIAASGDYLLNAVWVEMPEDASADMVTLWASLFFHQ